jgi:retinol dehydrogenase 14
VITGATSGIGLESAAQLAQLGHHVVMVGRDPAKTASSVAEVMARSASTHVESALGDFASQASVRDLAEDLLDRLDRIDVLVNNAGTVFDKRTVTEDGIEATFAVNHLGPLLLTQLLRERLEASTPARVVNVSSTEHYRGTIDLDDLGFERGGYQIMRAYGRSKLAMIMATRWLAAELEQSGVTVNALHPGAVRTAIWDGAPWYARPFLAVAKRFMISPEEGGAHIAYLATSPEVEGMTGLYFENDKPKKPNDTALDDDLTARLWAESNRLVGLVDA